MSEVTKFALLLIGGVVGLWILIAIVGKALRGMESAGGGWRVSAWAIGIPIFLAGVAYIIWLGSKLLIVILVLVAGWVFVQSLSEG